MTEREIFAAVLDVHDADERNEFLNNACQGNAALRDRITALLAEREQLMADPDWLPCSNIARPNRPSLQKISKITLQAFSTKYA